MPRRKRRKKSKKSSDSIADFDDKILKSLAQELKIRSWGCMKRSTIIYNLKPYYRNEQQLVDALKAQRKPNNIELQNKKPKSQYIHSFDRRPPVFKSMKVYEYSHMKLQKIKQNYASENNKRNIAKSKIRPPALLSNEETYNVQTRKQYLWSHLIPTEILKLIFMQSIDSSRAWPTGDKTVLSLIKTCKNWRNVIHQNENDKPFHSHVWYGCITHLGSTAYSFDWKHLGLIPDTYLNIITHLPMFQEMTVEEIKSYRKLSKCENKCWATRCNDERCSDAYDAENEEMRVGQDSNIPLIIATLSKCPNISSLTLTGWLCKDIFFAIVESCVGLHELELTYTEHGRKKWLDIFIEPQYAPVMWTVNNISIYKSFWVDTEVMSIISWFSNLVSLHANRLNLCGFALLYLFGRLRKLEEIQLDHCFYCDEYPEEWEEAFRRLARYNKVIRRISFDLCFGFADDCLKRLKGKNACPKLEELILNLHSCSEEMISKFKRAKPKVQFIENSL